MDDLLDFLLAAAQGVAAAVVLGILAGFVLVATGLMDKLP